MKYKITLLILSLFFAIFIFGSRDLTKRDFQTIKLTSNGFVPAGIRVGIGTKVRFITNTDRPFWPASDLHPNHAIYPEFDPKHEVLPNDFWTFTFDKEGTFRFHDHISPVNRGTIVVAKKNMSRSLDDCKEMGNIYYKKECFISFLGEMLSRKGPDYVFSQIAKIRSEDPDFASECHTIAHDLGGIAYWKYAKDGKLPETGAVAYCGFGFIHGFMTEYGHHNLDFVSEVNRVCDYFSNKLNYEGFEKMIDPFDQCYHGVGHGLAYLYIPEFGNSPEEVIKRGASDCEEITDNGYAVSNCKFGLFGGFSSVYIGGHGFTIPIDEKDPLKVCKSQSEDLKGACYDSMVATLGVLFESNLGRLVDQFSNIPETYFDQTFYSIGDLSSRWSAEGKVRNQDITIHCGIFNDLRRSSCFKGYVQGIVRNVFPGDIKAQVDDFCSNNRLSDNEKKQCLLDYESEDQLIYPKK